MRRDSQSSNGRRRQFRSCDQCRKGKRACDIVNLDHPVSPSKNGTHKSCSNCVRTHKSCTLEWLNSKPSFKRNQHDLGDSNQKPRHDRPLLPKLQTTAEVGDFDLMEQLLSLPPSRNFILEQETSFEQPATFSMAEQDIEQEESWFRPSPESLKDPVDDCARDDAEDEDFWFQEISNGSTNARVDGEVETTFINNTFDQRYESSKYSAPPYTQQQSHRHRHNKRRSFLGVSFSPHSSKGVSPNDRTLLSPAIQRSGSSSITNDPSSDTTEYQLASTTNRGFISSGLMKIYHDSVEHALSCWLTEVTCPYTAEVLARKTTMPDPMVKEWGSAWSNRILQRVCCLDKASSYLRSRLLTNSEEKAVGVALRKTIMAFAAQWAQSSERSNAEFSSLNNETCDGWNRLHQGSTTREPNSAVRDSDTKLNFEFDRTLQETFWHEAKQALHQTSHIESFRLAFANIIFSLVQRPLDVQERQSMSTLKISSHSSKGSTEGGITVTTSKNSFLSPEPSHKKAEFTSPMKDREWSKLDQILCLEEPPVFLERALRQIFSFRHKIETSEMQYQASMEGKRTTNDGMRQNTAGTTQSENVFSREDRETFNMLFWLGVMFDTLSAAMTQRPLVVSDEDSDVLPQDPQLISSDSGVNKKINLDYFEPQASPPTTGYLLTKDSPNLWDNFLLEKQSVRRRNKITRWPCTYETAASILCDAAPIKVLYFRRVTRLQTLIARRVRREKLEIAIHEALQINEYWITHFAPFFRDCIANHHNLPARIQSWYVILAGHWHLAGLLLADIIENIDNAGMGMDAEKDKRVMTQLVSNLRIDNAYSVSDLGRCSAPHHGSSFSQAKEFHFAINKGALLTEPWTEVLIRSFSKAGSVLLTLLSNMSVEMLYSVEELQDIRNRCESCVEALWHIGKKSDMALLASNVLLNALEEKSTQARNTVGTHLSPVLPPSGGDEDLFEGREPIPFVFTDSSTSGFWEDGFLWDGIST
ncbi:C6 zinc finger domain-containing protein [Phlyctema vagabunda]|uniref:C6 zinc finger domain-containing protein n=1 Tax=Phlyctema vagabunda TaxID=108571 RepID=A0ABR4PF36_9HELO